MTINSDWINQFDALIDLYQDEGTYAFSDSRNKVLRCVEDLGRVDSDASSSLLHKTVALLDKLNLVCDGKSVDNKLRQIQRAVFQNKRSLMKLIHKKDLVSLVVCFDFSPDHNEAIMLSLIGALNEGIPVIASRSLVAGKNSKIKKWFNKLVTPVMIKHAASDTRIFQQQDGEWGDEFLVFLPCSDEGILDRELLASYDLNDTLKKISVEEALKGSSGPCDLEGFQALFVDNPTHPKVVSIEGHGDSCTIAAVKKKAYSERLLPFLSKQKTQCLFITSCSSGGKSSLVHFGPSFADFPVVVRSTGDYITRSTSNSTQVNARRLRMVENALKEGSRLTRSKLKRITQDTEVSKTVFRNQCKILFTGSQQSPRGFQLLGESMKDVSLSLQELRKHQVTSREHLWFKAGDVRSIVLSPLVIPVAVVVEGLAPTLLSALPGNAQHYLDELSLPKTSLENFKKAHHRIAPDTRALKVFFIRTLKLKGKTLNHVALFYFNKRLVILYKSDGKHITDFGEYGAEEISSIKFQSRLKWMLGYTQPSPETVRHGIAGQENVDAVSTLVSDSWVVDRKRIEKLRILPNAKEVIDETLLTLTDDEAQWLFAITIASKKTALAKRLLLLRLINVNMRSAIGTPLIHNALKIDDPELKSLMLSRAPDVKALDPEKKCSLLTAAIQTGDEALVEELLKNPDINVNICEPSGWTPIFYALGKWDIVDLLIKAKAVPDEWNCKIRLGYTVIDHLIETEASLETIQGWIDHAKIGNSLKSKVELLERVAEAKNHEAFQLLLKNGLSPAGDQTRSEQKEAFIPLFDALYISDDNVFAYLLENTSDDELAYLAFPPLTLGQYLLKECQDNNKATKQELLLARGIALPE